MTLEEQIEDLKSQVEATNSKNKELLSELRQAKSKNKELDFDTYNKVLEENDTLKSELSKTKSELGLKAKDLEKLSGTLTEKENYLKNLTLENGLNEHLSSLGLNQVQLNRLKKSFKADATITDDGVVIDGKPIKDFMAEWSNSDEGKSFIPAPANSGTGATGSNGSATTSGKLDGTKAEQEAYIKAKFNL